MFSGAISRIIINNNYFIGKRFSVIWSSGLQSAPFFSRHPDPLSPPSSWRTPGSAFPPLSIILMKIRICFLSPITYYLLLIINYAKI